MPSYDCELCNFSTKLKTDFRRHLKTKKHEKKLNESMTLKESEVEKLITCSKLLKKLKNRRKKLKNCSILLKKLKFCSILLKFCSKK